MSKLAPPELSVIARPMLTIFPPVVCSVAPLANVSVPLAAPKALLFEIEVTPPLSVVFPV